jgi:hypothetical protein
MNTRNNLKNHRTTVKGIGLLLLLLCFMGTPVKASHTNVIGEKDTTIILFNNSRYVDQFMGQENLATFNLDSSIQFIEAKKIKKLSTSFTGTSADHLIQTGEDLEVSMLFYCNSAHETIAVDNYERKLPLQKYRCCILKQPI